jgi:hypothetical protein
MLGFRGLRRVFRLGKRSERLFDRLRKHWQQVGCITRSRAGIW